MVFANTHYCLHSLSNFSSDNLPENQTLMEGKVFFFSKNWEDLKLVLEQAGGYENLALQALKRAKSTAPNSD